MHGDNGLCAFTVQLLLTVLWEACMEGILLDITCIEFYFYLRRAPRGCAAGERWDFTALPKATSVAI